MGQAQSGDRGHGRSADGVAGSGYDRLAGSRRPLRKSCRAPGKIGGRRAIGTPGCSKKAEREATGQRKRADHEAEVAQQESLLRTDASGPAGVAGTPRLAAMRELLANWFPEEDVTDRRGWEWFYLNSLPYQNVRNLTESGSAVGRSVVAWHTASNRLAQGTADGLIRIWDVDREQPTLSLRGRDPI